MACGAGFRASNYSGHHPPETGLDPLGAEPVAVQAVPGEKPMPTQRFRSIGDARPCQAPGLSVLL